MGSFHSMKSIILFALIILVLNHDIPCSVHASVIDNGKQKDQNGTSELTELQKHVGFFDRNKDGLIYPSEIYEGLKALGVNTSTALESAASVSLLLGPMTQPKEKSSEKIPIYIENIKRATRPSKTSAFDGEGRFQSSNFEGIFTKYAKENPNSLTEADVMELVKDIENEKINRFAPGAWKNVYNLFKDKDGLLHKDALRDLYDGTLFYKREKENGSPASSV